MKDMVPGTRKYIPIYSRLKREFSYLSFQQRVRRAQTRGCDTELPACNDSRSRKTDVTPQRTWGRGRERGGGGGERKQKNKTRFQTTNAAGVVVPCPD